jgi:hypothetical protein
MSTAEVLKSQPGESPPLVADDSKSNLLRVVVWKACVVLKLLKQKWPG